MSLRRCSSKRSSRLWFGCFVLVSIAHFASYDVRNQPIWGDIRFYLYYAAQTADGADEMIQLLERRVRAAIQV